MDNEKEIVWTDVMGFMPPVVKTEGRTICRGECQLAEYKQEIERLREALKKIAEGDVERPVFASYRDDGKLSKHDQCRHGMVMYYDCGECIADYARAALKGGE